MRLTRDSQVPYHVIAPLEQVSDLKAFVLPANNRSYILVREVVQRARVFQWFQQTRTGLRVTTKEVAVKLLFTRGQIHRRHDVVLAVRGFRTGRKDSARINRQELGVNAGMQVFGRLCWTTVSRCQQSLEVRQALARYLFYADGQRWPEVCPARFDRRENRLMRVYPLRRPGQGRCRWCVHTAQAVL